MPAPECRFCGAPLEHTLVDLGETPLANNLLTRAQFGSELERRFPLHARICARCFLVQVDDVLPPSAIFTDYVYFSSYSRSWLQHAKQFALAAKARFKLDDRSHVIEVASNDGYLLQYFAEQGIPVLGIEPAANCAAAAIARGIPTEVMFFDEDTASELRDRGVTADLIVANNVIAHVPSIARFCRGFPKLLKPEGTLVLEFPHVLRLVEGIQFDTIYHEHFSYLSLRTLEQVFADAGLRAYDVQELSTHGGSLRVFACLREAGFQEMPGLARVRELEQSAGMGTLDFYRGFSARVDRALREFSEFLTKAKGEGRVVAGYGAAAKGNTLLNSCRVSPNEIRWVFDRSPHKQGKFLPGSRIEVLAPEKIAELMPDYLVVLPWNLIDELAAELSFVKAWGGSLVVAVPNTRILRWA
jgi:SAM-dependent methyltransferase